MADEDERGPSDFTLAEQIETLSKEIKRRVEIMGLSDPLGQRQFLALPRDTECLRAALRTLQAMIDDGK